MEIQRDELKQLQKYPRLIEAARMKVQRLRDQAGLHSVSLDGMPRGTGARDKIGTIVPDIVEAEEQLQQLEEEYWRLRLRVGDWIDSVNDIQVSLALSLRYLEGMKWDQVAKECGIDEGAARMMINRYLKKCE